MIEIEVKGHSGCQIDIAREDRDLYIYKSSYDAKYLSRLVKQAQKQQKAAVEEYQHVRIPQIYSIEIFAAIFFVSSEIVQNIFFALLF